MEPVGALAVRSLARYLVPALVLSVLAFAPLVVLALRLPVPADATAARAVIRVAQVLAGASAISLLLLVGGVAPLVRGLADGAPLTQLGALRAGVAGLARAVVPVALAFAAVLIGGLALVVPGVLVLVLVALTGASTAPDAASRIAEAVAIARTRPLVIAGVLAVTAVVIAAACVAAQRLALPMPKKPTLPQLRGYRDLARALVLALVAVAPVPAIVLAAVYARARR